MTKVPVRKNELSRLMATVRTVATPPQAPEVVLKAAVAQGLVPATDVDTMLRYYNLVEVAKVITADQMKLVAAGK